jgi:hypothetical protein
LGHIHSQCANIGLLDWEQAILKTMVQQALYRPGVSVRPPPASISANLVRIQKQSIRSNNSKELYNQSMGHWQHSSQPQQPVQPQRPQITQQEYQNINNSNSSANLQSNMFGAELAKYYTDDNDVKEIEAQSFPVETRFNRKRVRVIDKEDNNPAMQTSIPA